MKKRRSLYLILWDGVPARVAPDYEGNWRLYRGVICDTWHDQRMVSFGGTAVPLDLARLAVMNTARALAQPGTFQLSRIEVPRFSRDAVPA